MLTSLSGLPIQPVANKGTQNHYDDLLDELIQAQKTDTSYVF